MMGGTRAMRGGAMPTWLQWIFGLLAAVLVLAFFSELPATRGRQATGVVTSAYFAEKGAMITAHCQQVQVRLEDGRTIRATAPPVGTELCASGTPVRVTEYRSRWFHLRSYAVEPHG